MFISEVPVFSLNRGVPPPVRMAWIKRRASMEFFSARTAASPLSNRSSAAAPHSWSWLFHASTSHPGGIRKPRVMAALSRIPSWSAWKRITRESSRSNAPFLSDEAVAWSWMRRIKAIA
jgi:hypothetical protein